MKKTIGVLLALAFLIPTVSLAFGKNDFKAKFSQAKNEIKTELKTEVKTKDLDVACVQNAVRVREDSLISAFDTFSVSTKTALSFRKEALINAWAKTDAKERRTARLSAYDTHKEAMKNAHTALKASRKNAWDRFNTTLQSCGTKVSGYTETAPRDFPTSL